MCPFMRRNDLSDLKAHKPGVGQFGVTGASASTQAHLGLGLLCCTLILLLQACSSSDISIPAPVVDHSIGKSNYKDPKANVSARTPALVANEASSRAGYYTVKPGDTIYHISLDNGQNWKDLARWNNLDNPNVIEVGKVLRVLPPEAGVTTDGVVVRPVNSQNNPTSSTGIMTSVNASSATQSSSTVPTPPPSAANPAPPAVVVPQPAPSPASTQTSAASSTDNSSNNSETPNFIWPATGKVIATFDEAKNKGIDISGKLGDSVLASADGKVVYSGSGLRGYGNLLIIKHNNTYLSAYAHNQSILVKEDQNVKQGQKIAEIGSSDSDQPELHFEIRKFGKPVDPLKWLPPR